MTETPQPLPRAAAVIDTLYYLCAAGFFFYLFNYYLTTVGGPVLLAFTLVPFTYVIFTLDALRKGEFYPRLSERVNYAIAAVYIGTCLYISYYMYVEFEDLGTVRAGFWNTTDLWLGGLMFLLVMEYARKRYFELFIFNIVLILYAVYGFVVPGLFYHPGLSWERIVTSMSLEDTTGVFSGLPQLALTLIGSFVLVLAALRAFGCIDSILKGTSRIATHSAYALPQTAVIGSFGVAAVSGSGAANAVTTGSATIPALIDAGMPREDAAAIEASSSLGGQLMPPIMGISAFLMADFMETSYFDVVARGYAPAVIYFLSVAVGVYLLSLRHKTVKSKAAPPRLGWGDGVNISAFFLVVVGLILYMAVGNLPPMFAALKIFGIIITLLAARTALMGAMDGGLARAAHELWRAALRFFDHFTSMTADLTLLLATLSILTSAFVNTGVPTKVGFILVDAASINLVVMVLVAFVFGALLGMGLPPAPTYILTALVIVPHMIKAGVDPWPVHFFAFFLAVWGELTPPTSVVAAVTSKIAKASFMGTLVRAILLCSSLFVLMAAVFTRPELVLEPGLAQFGAMALVLCATLAVTFSVQSHMHDLPLADYAMRTVLFAVGMVALFHPDTAIAIGAAGVVVLFMVYWLVVRRRGAEAGGVASAKAA